MVEKLIDEAIRARQNAHAPYSRFQVGAALESADGRVFPGCNLENVSYGLTICAERVAIFKAVSGGCREFLRLAVVADTQREVAPCGACLQVIWELCGDILVIMANLNGKQALSKCSDLLPHPFNPKDLG